MELKGLILGIMFSLGIFAVKNGIGLYYYYAVHKRPWRNILFTVAYVTVYTALFLLSAKILKELNILQYVDKFQVFLKSGMVIHFIMALMMGLWGLALIKSGNQQKHGHHWSWIVMIFPCPVCLSVIIFSVGFLLAYFPEVNNTGLLFICFGFIAAALLISLIVRISGGWIGISPERLLGIAMLSMASYFLLSIIIMPQFSDLEKIYRITGYKPVIKDHPVFFSWILIGAAAVSLASGYFFKFRTRFIINKKISTQ